MAPSKARSRASPRGLTHDERFALERGLVDRSIVYARAVLKLS